MSTVTYFFRALRKAAIGVSMAGLAMAPAVAQNSKPERLKSAIVFNVLRFVDFPAASPGRADFCVENDAVASESFRAFSNKIAGTRRINVRVISSGAHAGCEVLYLAAASQRDIDRASQQGRLVMGEGRGFIDRGGSIGLIQSSSQVRFEVNLDAADKAGIKISSKLIRLAARVKR